VTGTTTLATSDIQATVNQFLAGQPLSNVNIQVYLSDTSGNNIGSWNNASFGQSIAVSLTASYSPIFPGMNFLQNPDSLSAKAVMLAETE
jgi:hypothetical protein